MFTKKQLIFILMALVILLVGCNHTDPTPAPTTVMTTTAPETTTVPPTTTLPPVTTNPPETTVPPTTAEPTAPPTTEAPVPPTTAEPTVPPTTEAPVPPPTVEKPTPPPETEPVETKPMESTFVLSFAGDCTFGDHIATEGAWGTFTRVVKNKYDYPFANVKHIFEADDYTFVNLEGPLTDYVFSEEEITALGEKKYRFKGPSAYANILVEGDVEFASFANNHSLDYGEQGKKDTLAALKTVKVETAVAGQKTVVTTDTGLKIGVYAAYFNYSEKTITNAVKWLKEHGAEVIVLSVHWGKERIYQPAEKEINLAHMAIDAGVNIVYGHHSHTIMPVEYYNGGVIYYSLGNFSFGGNRNPDDKDTAILQQEIIRHEDGTIELGELTMIPCRVSSITERNDFKPTPYEKDDPHYERAMSKLLGTYTGTYADNAKS